jgi:hypothetical protein
MPGLLGIDDDTRRDALRDLYTQIAARTAAMQAAPADTWMGNLPSQSPQALTPDTRFRAIDPNTYTADPMTLDYNYPGHTRGQMPPQWWAGPNRET